ncbi:MAG: esterase-like activity of phytase family protein [Spongiibacteraceae bacterium]
MKLKLSALSAALLIANGAMATPAFINGIAISGSLGDSYGTSVNDGRVGFFSDIYYDPNRNEWWGLSDRGPGGGTLNYDTRVQRFTIDIDYNTGAISNFHVAQTYKFTLGGSSLNGKASSPTSVLGNAFDPEGFVINPKNGNMIVSDEYGPSVYEIDRNTGTVVKTYNTPANLIPHNSITGVANFASDAGNDAGKRTNRGFEGLAISPDGKFAFAILQSAMLDEGAGNGTVNRIVKFDTETGEAVAQYAYEMKRSGQGQGVSALVAINENEFYVIERNNRGVGVGADLATADKEVYKINLNGATDVSNIDLDASGAVYTKVTKSAQIIDLDANTLAALGNKSPEKWEGLAIGPKLADGSYLLLAGTDNDYSVTQNANGQQFDVYFRFTDADPYLSSIQCPLGSTENCVFTSNSLATMVTSDYSLLPGVLHAYKISAAELGNYVAPVPVPAAAWMFGSALIGLAGTARKRRS